MVENDKIKELDASLAEVRNEIMGFSSETTEEQIADAQKRFKSLSLQRQAAEDVAEISKADRLSTERKELAEGKKGDVQKEELYDAFSDLMANQKARISLDAFGLGRFVNATSTRSSVLGSGGGAHILTRSEVPIVERQFSLLDAVNVQTADTGTVRIPIEGTGATSGAKAKAEGTAGDQSDYKTTLLTAPMEHYTSYVSIPEQFISDPETNYAVEYSRRRLAVDVRKAVETGMVSGNGTSPNMRGILSTSGIVSQSYDNDVAGAVTANTVARNLWAAIALAEGKVESEGFATPSWVALNPLRLSELRTAVDDDGRPFLTLMPFGDGMMPVIHGLPVIKTSALADTVAASGVAGFMLDTMHHTLFVNPSVALEITEGMNADDFAAKRRSIRASILCASVVTRPKAVAEIKGD